MPIACKYHCGRVVNIDFFLSDLCKTIDTTDKYHIILIEKGSLTLRINNQIFTFTAPCVITLKEDLTVDFIGSHLLAAKTIQFDVSFLNVNITYDLINAGQYEKDIEKYGFIPLNIFYEKSDRFSYFLPLSKDTLFQINTLFLQFGSAIQNQTDRRWSCRARLHLNAILELLYQVYTDYLNQEIIICDSKNPYVWVSMILEQIHSYYQKDISLDSLSKFIHINKTTVARRFKEITGYSVTDYIIRYRIQCATYSLSTTELSVGEIAKESGFSSESYFIKQFRIKMGVTPMQYRKDIVKRRKREFGQLNRNADKRII